MSRPYENYRDSGIEWLGEIPAHWEVTKIKHVSDDVQTGNTPSTDIEEYFENGEFNWFTPADFGDNLLLTNSKRKISDVALNAGVARIFRPKSVLMVGIGATLGKIGLCEEICSANQQVNAITFKENFNPYFGAYFLKAFLDVTVSQSTASTLAILNQSKTGDLVIVNPPESEKETIADYLNYKTAQIDRLIAQKEELMNLLQKKRQAIINEAVTQGLNPNFPQLDSGIEWLGKIPAHWDLKKLKYCVELNANTEVLEEPYFKVALENIESKTGRFIPTESSEFEGGGNFFKEGDVLFNKLRPYLVKVFHAERDGLAVGELLVLTPIEDVMTSRFLYYRMLSQAFIDVVDSSTYGAKMPRANWQFISNIKLPMPSVEEQGVITEYLDEMMLKFDESVIKLKDQIGKLKSYRQSIISEVVTGKVDVRDVVLNEV